MGKGDILLDYVWYKLPKFYNILKWITLNILQVNITSVDISIFLLFQM